MFKHHKIISFLIGFLYAIVLQGVSGSSPVFRVFVPIFLLFCFLGGYYNKKYLEHIQKYNPWVLLRSVLLFVSGFCIFILLPATALRILFLISAVFVISLFQLNLGNYAEVLLINETLVIAFGFYVSLMAWNQYFPALKLISLSLGKWHLLSWQFSMQPFYLLATFLITAILSRAFYEFIPQPDKTKWIGAVSLGLFLSELFWGLSFLPLHYSAQAVVLFCLFYFCLILNYYYLFNSLTLKKIQFHLALIIFACATVLLATPWRIIQ